MAKKAKGKRRTKSLKAKDLTVRGGAAKVKGGGVGPCWGKRGNT